MMLLIIVGFGLIGLLDFVPMLKYGKKSSIAVFVVFFVLAFALALMLYYNVKVPSIHMLVEDLFESIGLAYPQE